MSDIAVAFLAGVVVGQNATLWGFGRTLRRLTSALKRMIP